MSSENNEEPEVQAIQRIQEAPQVPMTLSVRDLVGQVQLIQEAMAAVMKENVHYGVIPGTDKPTLLKAGAEKLCLLFRMDPQYDLERTTEGHHLDVVSKCTLYHLTTGRRIASGYGSCSTRESRYAWRKSERTCPSCSKASIIKGKAEYGGGWICWAKKGGCGAKFKDGNQSIEGQSTDRVQNPDLEDQWNTVIKMACKRSFVAAVLNGTAASDVFTQDIEDLPDFAPKDTVAYEVKDTPQRHPDMPENITADLEAVVRKNLEPPEDKERMKLIAAIDKVRVADESAWETVFTIAQGLFDMPKTPTRFSELTLDQIKKLKDFISEPQQKVVAEQ